MNRILSLDPFSENEAAKCLPKRDKDGWLMNFGKKSRKKSKQKRLCWKGYHRVKGTVPYSKKSCVKNKF